MKKIALLLLAISFLGFSNYQTSSCKKVKVGSFKVEFEIEGVTNTSYIERTKKFQIEKNEDAGYEFKLAIKWIDDCTYELRHTETIRNENNIPVDKSMVLTVKILEVNDNYYIQESSSSISDMVWKSKVYIL